LLITIIVLIILTEADGFDVGIDSASGDQIPVENPKRSQINDSELL